MMVHFVLKMLNYLATSYFSLVMRCLQGARIFTNFLHGIDARIELFVYLI